MLPSQLELLRHEDRLYEEALQKSISHKKCRSHQFVRTKSIRNRRTGVTGLHDGNVAKWLHNHEGSKPVLHRDERYYDRKCHPRKNIIDEVMETPSLSDSTISSSLVSVSSYGSRHEYSYTLHKRTKSELSLEKHKIVV